MTLKKLFDKVDTYNEVAELMNARKARIYFSDSYFSGKHFDNYSSLRKYIKAEYIEELAGLILKADTWEFDKEVKFVWNDYFGDTHETIVTAELTA